MEYYGQDDIDKIVNRLEIIYLAQIIILECKIDLINDKFFSNIIVRWLPNWRI